MSDARGVEDRDQRAGATRDGRRGEPLSPWWLVLLGACSGLGAWLCSENDAGWVAEMLFLGVAVLCLAIGLVALGTMLGVRRQRWLDER